MADDHEGCLAMNRAAVRIQEATTVMQHVRQRFLTRGGPICCQEQHPLGRTGGGSVNLMIDATVE